MARILAGTLLLLLAGIPIAGAQEAPVSGLAAAAEQLRRVSRVPLSVIEAGYYPPRGYQIATFSGRPVLYPRDSAWDTMIERSHAPAPRLVAFNLLAVDVDGKVPGLKGLVGPGAVGNLTTPFYSTMAQHRPHGTVVEMLVDLLGDDPALYFTVRPGPADALLLQYHTVAGR